MVKILWNRDAFRQLRTLPGVAAELDRRGEAVARTANSLSGGTHAVHSTTSGGRGRHRTVVVTADREAMKASARDNTLLRALDAGRG